ncbi:alpha-1,6-mannosylglycoprotein 6-beta-N-acetylglucosaminyltransferase A-like isoform X2 [Solea solea]|uniref:alpha-1,6-mannosylglycoprotein 6-beta-N-acetylglucosaminyltransferase A-like isoform X2 n=1 Tax=Solea solea TaxID=90069 RepID=UPI00272A0922|nr:alpha-1,6-mannosylglycoprotein 6-beta-N-acetylglucosaminyltransferase A-like isoform X2 [Solea solea]
MRILRCSLWGTLSALLGITFIWYLSLSYILLNKLDQEGRGSIGHSSLRHGDHVGMEKSEAKDYMHTVQIKLGAEGKKEQPQAEMMEEKTYHQVQLQQQQVPWMEELLKQRTEKVEKKDGQEKSDDHIQEDRHCLLPSVAQHPACISKLKWMSENWETEPCYRRYGVNGSLCSFIIYLSEIESWCPLLPGRLTPSEKSEVGSDPAVIRTSMEDLYPLLENKVQLQWIHQRIKSMADAWVDAGNSLSAKYNLTGRKVKHILLHPGALTDESGFKIPQYASKGGPLGELVQWSDLIATLHVLGHRLHISASLPQLRILLGIRTDSCPPPSAVEANLIYTDIKGLRQFKGILKHSWTIYKCRIRVLDSFGTEPDFNHADWGKTHNRKSPYGGLHLIPAQFNTMFPHTPDNTFLGFVVQDHLSSKSTAQFNSIRRKNQALIYGKNAKFWTGKRAYLDVVHKYFEMHATVDDSPRIPRYVKNHGIVKGTELQMLLRQSKVFVGLSFPFEGPGPLEALANGCAFLNPVFDPPLSSLNSHFFKWKPNTREVTSQHPYVEAIGEPYVWMVDMFNTTQVERALTAILNQSIEPYLPYEFTSEGMLQRVNTLIEKQDFCSSTKTWPPLSALQVVMAEVGTSCKQACQAVGLICEPAFFPQINSINALANYGIDCQTIEIAVKHVVAPAFDGDKHCVLQLDPLLFSCVRSSPSLLRICPCRDYIKDQIALCKTCI